jgi:hypothetical protein
MIYENPDHYVPADCGSGIPMAGRVHDYPEQIAAGFEARAVTDKYYYVRHPTSTASSISAAPEKRSMPTL